MGLTTIHKKMPPLKIIVFHSELGVLNGGGETYTRQLMGHMLSRGHPVTAVFRTSLLGRYPHPLPEGFVQGPVKSIWQRTPGQGALTYIGEMARFLGMSERTWSRIQTGFRNRTIRFYNAHFRALAIDQWRHRLGEYDVAYVHGDPLLAYQVANSLVTCLRLPGPVSQESVALFDKIDCVCANGDTYRQMSALSDAVYHLPVGIDAEFFTPEGPDFRRELGLEDKTVLGYVGRLAQIKGVKELVSTFLKLAPDFPDIHLVLIGDGEMRRALQSIVKTGGLMSRCHFVGNQERTTLPQWYRTLDVFVLPSHYENFSNALLEAMACGLPVIASRVGGNPTLVNEKANGWLFEHTRPDDLLHVFQACLLQRAQWRTMGAVSREMTISKYSWAEVATAFEAMISQAFEESRKNNQ